MFEEYKKIFARYSSCDPKRAVDLDPDTAARIRALVILRKEFGFTLEDVVVALFTADHRHAERALTAIEEVMTFVTKLQLFRHFRAIARDAADSGWDQVIEQERGEMSSFSAKAIAAYLDAHPDAARRLGVPKGVEEFVRYCVENPDAASRHLVDGGFVA